MFFKFVQIGGVAVKRFDATFWDMWKSDMRRMAQNKQQPKFHLPAL